MRFAKSSTPGLLRQAVAKFCISQPMSNIRDAEYNHAWCNF